MSDFKRQKTDGGLQFTDVLTGATGNATQMKASYEAGSTSNWEASIEEALTVGMAESKPEKGGNSSVKADELMFAYVHKTFPHKGFSLCLIDPSDESSTVYVHSNVCDTNLLSKDQPVAFKVHMNSKNQPQASSPLWRLVGLQGLEAGAAVSWGEFEGRITGRMPNGCASVHCPEVEVQYGKAVYVTKDVVEACQMGPNEVFRFNVTLDSEGFPAAMAPLWKAAKDVPEKGKGKDGKGKMGKDDWGMMKGKGKGDDWDMMMGKGMGKDGGKCGKGKDGNWCGPTTIEIALGDSQTQSLYVGCVGKVSEDLQYALFFCPDSGSTKPVYSHRSVVDPSVLSEHDMACFPLHWNHKGDPQALAPLWKLVGDTTRMKGLGFGEYVGRISKVTEKGSGFLEAPQVAFLHGRDPYLHNKTIEGSGLKEGDFIVFDIHLNSAKVPQVSEPVWKCMSPATVTSVWNERMSHFVQKAVASRQMTANDSWVADAEEEDWNQWMDAAWYMMNSMMMMTTGKGPGDFGKGKDKGKGKWDGKGKDGKDGKGKGKKGKKGYEGDDSGEGGGEMEGSW